MIGIWYINRQLKFIQNSFLNNINCLSDDTRKCCLKILSIEKHKFLIRNHSAVVLNLTLLKDIFVKQFLKNVL